MTLMDAKEYDPVRERRRKLRIWTAVSLVIVVAFLAWMFRFWPEERIVDHFFARTVPFDTSSESPRNHSQQWKYG